MHKQIGNFIKSSVLLLAVVGISGCATAAKSIDAGEQAAQATAETAGTVVFGKLRLVRNGEETVFGDNIFSNSAKMHLSAANAPGEIVGDVGAGGEFEWVLEPGYYRLSNISFNNRGERVKPVTNFTFVVSPNQDAVYIGTVTMEATFDSGYYGVNGTVDGYAISNDCATECPARLSKLGLSASDMSVALLRQHAQLASVN